MTILMQLVQLVSDACRYQLSLVYMYNPFFATLFVSFVYVDEVLHGTGGIYLVMIGRRQYHFFVTFHLLFMFTIL